jgi:hypothetical protein
MILVVAELCGEEGVKKLLKMGSSLHIHQGPEREMVLPLHPTYIHGM